MKLFVSKEFLNVLTLKKVCKTKFWIKFYNYTVFLEKRKYTLRPMEKWICRQEYFSLFQINLRLIKF